MFTARSRPRSRSTVASLVASVSLLASPLLGGVAHADSQGYIDNFSGNVVVQYNGTTLPVSVAPLKPTLDAQWGLIQGQACQMLRQKIQPSAWNTCTIPATGELRAKQLGSGSVGLKYVVPGDHLNFDLGVDGLGGWADATIDVTFDAELDLALNIANGIDGAVPSSSADYSGQPVTIGAATFHLTNVRISSSNVIANLIDFVTGAFGKAEASLQTPQNEQGKVAPAVQAMNPQFHTGAKSLGDLVRDGNPASNWFFNLDMLVQPTQLVVRFRRDFAPPAVPNCTPFYQDDALTGMPGIHALTYCVNTTDTLAIQLQQSGGAWANEPTLASDYFGSGNTRLEDPNSMSQSGTFTYRVCATNIYGVACAAPTSISPNFNPPSYGGGAGGQEPVVNPHHPNFQ